MFYLNNINNTMSSEDIQIKDKEYQGKSIQSISVSNKFLKSEDWNRIDFFISNNQQILSLELSGISINKEGFDSLKDIIKNFPQLKELKLEWNEISESKIEFDLFCEALIQSNINVLYLNNNKINHEVIPSITKLIKHASNLSYLDLRWNEINDDSAKMIYDVLKRNTSLIYVNLLGNKIHDEVLLKNIGDAINRNKVFNENYYNTNSGGSHSGKSSRVLFSRLDDNKSKNKHKYKYK